MSLNKQINSQSENITQAPKVIKALKLSDANFRAICAVCVVVLAALLLKYSFNKTTLTNDLAVTSSALDPATETINPNTDDWPGLSRLPGIGPVRAKSICLYRDQQLEKYPNSKVFTCVEDLQAVNGIGPKTIDKISAWISFTEDTTPQEPAN